jgi:hypothetical protein
MYLFMYTQANTQKKNLIKKTFTHTHNHTPSDYHISNN